MAAGPVSRVHDIGGQAGIGQIPLGDDGQPFSDDWEARVYALNAVLRARGLHTTAIEALLAGKGVG